MTPESRVKRRVTEQLRALGAYYFFPATGGYGSSGVPDIVGCYKGRFFAIECKAGANKTTALQEKQIRDIRNANGAVMVVNESNQAKVTEWLEQEANHRE